MAEAAADRAGDAGRSPPAAGRRAVAGTLSAGQHAELERLLIGYWRRRLELEQAGAGQADRAAAEPRRGRPAAAPARRLAAPAGRNGRAGRRRRPAQAVSSDRGRRAGRDRPEAAAAARRRAEHRTGAITMSFAYPAVLALLVVPVLLDRVGLAANGRAGRAAVRPRRPVERPRLGGRCSAWPSRCRP